MAWLDLKGNRQQIDFLKSALNKNRLAHSFLLLGAEGIGKKLLAIEFAKFLLCDNPGKDGACGKCQSCIKCTANAHPDLHIFSQKEFDWIKIEEMRKLQLDLSLSAYSGKWKIAIIDNAHMLTPEAANCLLKTMEEPPRESLIFLIANRIDSIPETIISRCQRLYFSPLSSLSIEEAIIEDSSANKSEVRFLTKFCEGRLGRALVLARDKELFVNKNRLLHNLLNKTKVDFNDFSTNLDKENIQLSMEFLLFFLRDCLMLKVGLDKDSLVNIDEADTIQKLARRVTLGEIEEALDCILRAQEINKTNINPKILLTWLLGQLKHKLKVHNG